MDRVERVLLKLGLSENEIKVYREILKSEYTTHYHVSKKSHVPRSTVYDAVNELVHKKLVTLEQVSGQTRIIPLQPNQLSSLVHEKISNARELEADVSSILEKLTKSTPAKTDNGESGITYLPGRDGAERAYYATDFTNIHGERIAITDLNSFNSFAGTPSKATREVLIESDWLTLALKRRLSKDSDFVKQSNYRVVSSDFPSVYTRTMVIQNKVLYAALYKNESWGMIIDSSALAETIKAQFEYLWAKGNDLTASYIRSLPELDTPEGTVDSPSISIDKGGVTRLE